MSALPVRCVVCVILLSGSAVGLAAPPAAGSAEETSPARVNDDRFHSRLLEIAQGYLKFALVEDRPQLAPTLCRAPTRSQLPMPRRSESDEQATHGQKLYFLFAAKADGYLRSASRDNPVGQVLVKESWNSEPADPPDVRKVVRHACGKQVLPYTIDAQRQYHRATEQRDLYVMFKLSPDTPGTDQGWVYGTLTPDGRQVTSAGRVESCMECHRQAPRDRLFGLPSKRPEGEDPPARSPR